MRLGLHRPFQGYGADGVKDSVAGGGADGAGRGGYLLSSMERQDSAVVARSRNLGAHLNDIQGQLRRIASKLKGHHDTDSASRNDDAQPTLADIGWYCWLYVNTHECIR